MSKLQPEVNQNDHVTGNLNAPIVLVEYGDYECPYCGEAFPIVKKIQEKLGDNLLFVFRNFPLTEMHPHAAAAAEAAEAAALQGKFWEMHDKLYENQDALEMSNLEQYAKELGLDVEKFKTDMQSEAVVKRIKADVESGAMSGVNGTPAFYINGQQYNDSYDLDVMLPALESLL